MDLLTTKEAAEELSVTAGRVRQMILSGELPAEKMGRDLFVRRKDVDKLKDRPKVGRPRKAKGSK
jgi:excisionase family DNA binding protein